MELLTCTVGETALALISDQVSRVERWDLSQVAARQPLDEALGMARGAPCTRALVCRSAAGDVAFGISSALEQKRAAPGSIVGLSRVLKRLRAPSWLAGFFVTSGGLALIVDLAHLSSAAHPAPKEATR